MDNATKKCSICQIHRLICIISRFVWEFVKSLDWVGNCAKTELKGKETCRFFVLRLLLSQKRVKGYSKIIFNLVNVVL